VGNNPSQLLMALVVVALLGLVVRWVFAPSRRRTGPLVDASDSPELGLLEVIATGLTRAEAMTLRATLGEAEIRSSMSRRHDGRLDVLVFRTDLDRARELLG
jgi:hypothetical protein